MPFKYALLVYALCGKRFSGQRYTRFMGRRRWWAQGMMMGALLVCAVGALAQGPQVAFTFDDLPAHGPLPPGMARPAVVKSILQTLKRENLPPVFGFVNGFRVARYPYQIHILQAWVRAGEPLGNHTWSHPELDKLSAAQYEANIARNEPLLRGLESGGLESGGLESGGLDSKGLKSQGLDSQGEQADWHWFRYPFLEEGDTVAKREAVRDWLQAHGYRIAEASMDFQDYLWNEPYARCAAKHDTKAIQQLHDTYLATADTYIGVYRELAQRLYGHDVPYILLMHAGAFDARMLPELLALFRRRGFTFTTLQTAMADPIYQQDPEVPTPGGSTFNEMVAAERRVNVPDAQEPEQLLDHLCR